MFTETTFRALRNQTRTSQKTECFRRQVAENSVATLRLPVIFCCPGPSVPGKVDHVSQAEAIASARAFLAHAGPLRDHLSQILQSPIFRGSPRSQEFLKHIVQKALEGDFDALKERSIGTELFGRSPTYDTSEDAIVRVAASDVRKRLLQYYGTTEGQSRFRIEVPAGTYIPAFCLTEPPARTEPEKDAANTRVAPAIVAVTEEVAPPQRNWKWIGAVGVLAAAALGVLLWLASGSPQGSRSAKNTLPWSALFGDANRRTQIILCDTNMSMLHTFLGFQISLSDYANRRYLPELDRSLNPDVRRILRDLAGIDYTAPTAAVDAMTALRISQLAGPYAARLMTRPSRSLQLRDFDTDDNFILLGSPNSNPWHALFSDQLDFSFVWAEEPRREVLRNNRPQAGELAQYVPNALGGATGQAFSTVAFVSNPHRTGHVLLIAGTTAEATEAAANFIADVNAISATLRRYGVDSTRLRHFQALLKVTEMAGAPAKFDVIALHLLH